MLRNGLDALVLGHRPNGTLREIFRIDVAMTVARLSSFASASDKARERLVEIEDTGMPLVAIASPTIVHDS